MRVKIFSNSSNFEIEDEINDWIKEDDVLVIKIHRPVIHILPTLLGGDPEIIIMVEYND